MARPRLDRIMESVGARVPTRLKWGMELFCRREKVSLARACTRAYEDLLENHGITSRAPGEAFSLLDRVWNEDEIERLRLLQQHAPMLAVPKDRHAIEFDDFIRYAKDWDEVKKGLRRKYLSEGGIWPFLQDLSNRAYDNALKANPALGFKTTKAMFDHLKARYDEELAAHEADMAGYQG